MMLVAQPHEVYPSTFDETSANSSLSSHEPLEITQRWLNGFDSFLAAAGASRVADIIHPAGWWRDYLALS